MAIFFLKSVTIIHSLLCLIKLYLIISPVPLQNLTFSNFDETKFIEDFSAMDLDILHDSNAPVNEKFNCFYDKLSNLVDTHVP